MNKKIVKEYLKKGDKINAKVVFDDGKAFKVEFVGEIKSMSDNNSGGFSNKQLEQLQGLLKPIVERLDIIEKDIKLIKNTPTMQRELK